MCSFCQDAELGKVQLLLTKIKKVYQDAIKYFNDFDGIPHSIQTVLDEMKSILKRQPSSLFEHQNQYNKLVDELSNLREAINEFYSYNTDVAKNLIQDLKLKGFEYLDEVKENRVSPPHTNSVSADSL